MLIQEYLEQKGIEYHLPGEKNVSKGWINIRCPFCYDHSWHCGINLSSGLFHCWLCGTKGDIYKIIIRLEANPSKTHLIRSKLSFGTELVQDYRVDIKNSKKGIKASFNLPKFVSKSPLQVHLDFLKKRRYDPEEVIEKYDLYFGHTTGIYRHSIIIPVFSDGIPVCFVATDCTRNRYKYKNSPKITNIMNHSECLYNYHGQEEVTLVEGIFDAWRIDGVALLTKRISAMQLLKLAGKKIRIWLDPDAQEEARKIAGLVWWTEPVIVESEFEPDDCF